MFKTDLTSFFQDDIMFGMVNLISYAVSKQLSSSASNCENLLLRLARILCGDRGSHSAIVGAMSLGSSASIGTYGVIVIDSKLEDPSHQNPNVAIVYTVLTSQDFVL